jgi:hypothetical protein
VPASAARSPNSAPSRSPGSGTPSRSGWFFAGGGFSADSPGGLLDVLGKSRGALRGDPQLPCGRSLRDALSAGGGLLSRCRSWPAGG